MFYGHSPVCPGLFAEERGNNFQWSNFELRGLSREYWSSRVHFQSHFKAGSGSEGHMRTFAPFTICDVMYSAFGRSLFRTLSSARWRSQSGLVVSFLPGQAHYILHAAICRRTVLSLRKISVRYRDLEHVHCYVEADIYPEPLVKYCCQVTPNWLIQQQINSLYNDDLMPARRREIEKRSGFRTIVKSSRHLVLGRPS